MLIVEVGFKLEKNFEYYDKNDIVSFPSTWEKYISKYKKPKEINIKQLRC